MCPTRRRSFERWAWARVKAKLGSDEAGPDARRRAAARAPRRGRACLRATVRPLRPRLLPVHPPHPGPGPGRRGRRLPPEAATAISRSPATASMRTRRVFRRGCSPSRATRSGTTFADARRRCRRPTTTPTWWRPQPSPLEQVQSRELAERVVAAVEALPFQNNAAPSSCCPQVFRFRRSRSPPASPWRRPRAGALCPRHAETSARGEKVGPCLITTILITTTPPTRSIRPTSRPRPC